MNRTVPFMCWHERVRRRRDGAGGGWGGNTPGTRDGRRCGAAERSHRRPCRTTWSG